MRTRLVLAFSLLLTLAGAHAGQGAVYDASAKPIARQATGNGSAGLAVLYASDLWPNGAARVELDEQRVRTLVRVLSRVVKVVVFDFEEPAWMWRSDFVTGDDEHNAALAAHNAAVHERHARLVGWCRTESPTTKLAIYPLPYADFTRNILAGNEWHARWRWLNDELAAAPWFGDVDYLCPDLYLQAEDFISLDAAKRRAALNLAIWRQRFPNRKYIVFVSRRSDAVPVQPKWFVEWVAYLDRLPGVDVAIWEGP